MQAFKSDKNIKARIGVFSALILVVGLVGWLFYDKEAFNSESSLPEKDKVETVETEKTGYGEFNPEFYSDVQEEKVETKEAKKLREISITAIDYTENGSNGYIKYLDKEKEFKTKLSPYTVVFDEATQKVVYPDKISKGDKLSVYLNEDNSAKVVVKGNKFSYLVMTDVVSIDGTNYIITERDKSAVQLGTTISSAYVDREVDVSEVKYGDGVLYVSGGVVENVPSELEGYTIHTLAKAKLLN